MNKPLALIIEDELDLSEIYSKALQGGGFETEMIRDGKAALARLKGTPPAIVILDLHLPHVEGATILQHIRAQEGFKQTSVIITTADERLAEEMNHGADLVLLKPVSIGQLRELANRLVNHAS
jgi:DNA-binding response OmpR family regulator